MSSLTSLDARAPGRGSARRGTPPRAPPARACPRRRRWPARRAAAAYSSSSSLAIERHRLAHLGLDPLPARARPADRARAVPGDAAVLLDEIEAIDGDEQPVAARELQHHEVAVEAAALGAPQARVARDAVVHVDDEVADLEVAEVGDEGGAASGPCASAALRSSPKISRSERTHEAELRELEAGRAGIPRATKSPPALRTSPGTTPGSC